MKDSTFLYGAHVSANGIRQHYLRFGGQGQPLLLVPGITSPAITWDFVAERLGQQFDTYILDVRGRGLSASGPELAYDTDTCADDVVAFAQALELEHYILAGHSMGGRHVLRAMTRGAQGVDKLVLMDPPVSGPGRREYPGKLPWYTDSIRDCLRGADIDTMRSYCPTWTEDQLRLRAEWLHTCYEPAVVQSLQEFHSVDIHQDMPHVTCPTLLMCASRGGVIEAQDREEIEGLLSQPTISVVEDAGHMIPWDNFDGCFEVLSQFLATPL